MPQSNLSRRTVTPIRQTVSPKPYPVRQRIYLQSRGPPELRQVTETKTVFESLAPEYRAKGYIVDSANNTIYLKGTYTELYIKQNGQVINQKTSGYIKEKLVFDSGGNIKQKIVYDVYRDNLLDNAGSNYYRYTQKPYAKEVVEYQNNTPVSRKLYDIKGTGGRSEATYQRGTYAPYLSQEQNLVSGEQTSYARPKERVLGTYGTVKRTEQQAVIRKAQEQKVEDFFAGKPVLLDKSERAAFESVIGRAAYEELIGKQKGEQLVSKINIARENDLAALQKSQKLSEVEKYNRVVSLYNEEARKIEDAVKGKSEYTGDAIVFEKPYVYSKIEEFKPAFAARAQKEIVYPFQAAISPALKTQLDWTKPMSLVERGTEELASLKSKTLTELDRSKSPTERILKGTFVLGGLGAARGALNVVKTVRYPIKTLKAQVEALKTPVQTFKAMGEEWLIDPVGVTVEYYTFSKGFEILGKSVKKSPVGRFVQEEIFIRTQPTKIQPYVRALIKSAKIQEKINPEAIRSIRKVDFVGVKTLTKIEAKALLKALKQTDSVVFGSAASRILSKGKTAIPKDVDLATASAQKFSQKFIESLPKTVKSNYTVQGGKLYRLIRSSDKIVDKYGLRTIRGRRYEAIFDVKPLSRLIPQKSLFTGRGNIPVSGYVTKLEKGKGSILPTLKKKAISTAFEVPTQKLVKVGGIKVIGFGEQTTRKALGTLQVLIEKNVKRAKDPQSFITGLKVQIEGLKVKRNAAKTKIGKAYYTNKITKLDNAVKLLTSKGFIKLLDSKVPGLSKQYPLLTKIDKRKLKKVSVSKAIKEAKKIISKTKDKTKGVSSYLPLAKSVGTSSKLVSIEKLEESIIPSKLPKKSSLSRIPKPKPSRIPSILGGSIVPLSRLASRVPSKVPTSRLKGKAPSKIPVSKTPSKITSKLPRSALGKSFIPMSKLSKLPISRIPTSKIPRAKAIKLRAPKTQKLRKKEKKSQRKKIKIKNVVKNKFIYISDLYSRYYGISISKRKGRKLLTPGRVFTGTEDRAIIRRR